MIKLYDNENMTKIIEEVKNNARKTRELLEEHQWVTLDQEDYNYLFYKVGKETRDFEIELGRMESKYINRYEKDLEEEAFEDSIK